MKKYFVILLLSALSIKATSQPSGAPVTGGVKWYTIQEAEKLIKQSPRPIFVDAYTDWCGWCKKMDSDTFTNSVIIELLNNKFYPVKFDAEGKDPVTFLGQAFINENKGANSPHQLAIALLNGQLSYPTVVFLYAQKDGKLAAAPVPGYKQPKEMEVLLSFFADKAYDSQKWEDYQKNFQGKVK